MMKEEEAIKTLDELLYSVQMDAYFKGYKTGYLAGSEEPDKKEDRKRSILTEEEETGAAKRGERRVHRRENSVSNTVHS